MTKFMYVYNLAHVTLSSNAQTHKKKKKNENVTEVEEIYVVVKLHVLGIWCNFC